MKQYTLQIRTKIKGVDYVQEPITLDGVTWETARYGEPAKLTFTIVKDKIVSFPKGAGVAFTHGGHKIFSGYVFEKKRNKDQHIEVTCYDRTIYLKNKENYIMGGVRADQIITRVADDMRIPIGSIANTGYVIPKFSKSDMTLFDIVQDALDETMMATGELYCLYDDFGKLTLKHIKDMQTDLLICNDTAEDFDYTTSINGNTYNSIVLTDDEGNTHVENGDSHGKWGVLQHVANVGKETNKAELAKKILSMYNQVSRTLTINKALGDARVRAGSMVWVHLHLGDHVCSQNMIVNRATHTFENDHHTMELTLIDGRGFYG